VEEIKFIKKLLKKPLMHLLVSITSHSDFAVMQNISRKFQSDLLYLSIPTRCCSPQNIQKQ